MARRGAPSKEVAIKNRKDRLEKKLVEEVLKANELMLDNYGKCVEVLINAATGEMKGVSTTNRISSAKFIKQMVDELLKQDEESKQPAPASESPSEQKPEEAKATGTTGQVYSLIQTNFEEK